MIRSASITAAGSAYVLLALVGWPLTSHQFAHAAVDTLMIFLPASLVAALTVEWIQQWANRPRWQTGTVLMIGLGLAIASGWLMMPTPWGQPVALDLGLSSSAESLKLSNVWKIMIVTSAAIIYLLQRESSAEAEHRLDSAHAQLQQARRRMRAIRDTTSVTRLDPSVLFECLGRARREYVADDRYADRVLERLIGFLRASMSGADTAGSNLNREIDLLSRYAALSARNERPLLYASTEQNAVSIELAPGLLLPLLKSWLRQLDDATASGDEPPFKLHAWLQRGVNAQLCLRLSGPCHPIDAPLSQCRAQLVEIYGRHAELRTKVDCDKLEVLLTLPTEAHP